MKVSFTMLKLFTLIASLVFVTFGVLLGVLNPTPVKLDLFFLTPTLPMSIVMALIFILGLALGAGLIGLKVMKFRWSLNRLEKRSRQQANQIIELKKQLAMQQISDKEKSQSTQIAHL